jgi:hypothetical protein
VSDNNVLPVGQAGPAGAKVGIPEVKRGLFAREGAIAFAERRQPQWTGQ